MGVSARWSEREGERGGRESTCQCVCVRARALVSANVWVGGVCGCASTWEREGGRERRAGVYVSMGCVMICLDFF